MTPGTIKAWGLYNGGILWGVERTRKECVREAERLTAAPWSECKKYMQIYKVTVSLRKHTND